MSIAYLIIMAIALFFILIVIVALFGVRILHKTGFSLLIVYVIMIVIMNFATDLKPDYPVPDYFNLGLTTLGDYVYVGFYVCIGIGFISFIFKLVRFIRGLL